MQAFERETKIVMGVEFLKSGVESAAAKDV
jgi:hypothetical protein